MNREQKTMFLLVGVATLAVTLVLLWCPPALCRVLNIQTYGLSTLSDYRQLMADEEAFYSAHHARAVRIDCAILRDEVVAALKTGRLTLGAATSGGVREREIGQDEIEAWHQGRVLHLTNRTVRTDQEQQIWSSRVRAAIAGLQQQEAALLARLFGGLVLHVSRKQIPIVLFSDHPCV